MNTKYRATKGATPLSNEHSNSLIAPSYLHSNILKNLPDALPSVDDALQQQSPLKVLKTPPGKRPRGKSKKNKYTPELKPKNAIKAGTASNLKFTESLRTQGNEGDNTIRVPAGESVRKSRSTLNKVFEDDFINILTLSLIHI